MGCRNSSIIIIISYSYSWSHGINVNASEQIARTLLRLGLLSHSTKCGHWCPFSRSAYYFQRWDFKKKMLNSIFHRLTNVLVAFVFIVIFCFLVFLFSCLLLLWRTWINRQARHQWRSTLRGGLTAVSTCSNPRFCYDSSVYDTRSQSSRYRWSMSG